MIPIDKYPYTDLHELNLDYVLEVIRALEAKIKELEERIEALGG